MGMRMLWCILIEKGAGRRGASQRKGRGRTGALHGASNGHIARNVPMGSDTSLGLKYC
jgi:hypothetical protein